MSDSVMHADEFWRLIDSTIDSGADEDQQCDALRTQLRQLSSDEIEAFERAFQREQRRAFSWDLVGAAHVVLRGASDDGFEYFMRWLISKGRAVFEAAVADPDSLADVLPSKPSQTFDFEGFAYIASEVWSEKTGINPWTDPNGAFPYTGAPPADEPSGMRIETGRRQLKEKYPRLWRRFR